MPTNRRNQSANLNRTMEMSSTAVSLAARMKVANGRAHCLLVMRGLDVGNVIRMEQSVLVVGRDESCDVIFNDEGMSRQHARFRIAGDRIVLEDLGSTNGVFLNGNPIETAVLQDGDKILLGRFTILKYSQQDELELEYQRRIHESASVDGLTGALNRRAFESRLEAEWSFSQRHGTDVTVIMLDVDFFKRVNDTFGHATGDEVLRAISKTVRATIRAEDLFGRYGGEEFVLAARGVGHLGGMGLATRIRVLIEALRLTSDGHPVPVTISLGVATSTESRVETAPELVHIADTRLYRAKESGRNRVVGD